ncbi:MULTISPECIES: RNA 3'-terminal phosphate cyclase [Corallococcus]|uniref:RNA 3'-terminal phosphate cyclase n=1 Tax=Corallococcus TaxID=83461 RepID=UPI00117CD61B|nr:MULTISPECIES: RNA 3'-terminal phosphate cyclase [Corallococcus]NBD11145.1 RNA 3'-phosphate cyclase [Corallococcus silvisoli]TSC26656.1 RNA 3'-terminal phosphate cyclase [Corallococcus sp. Z5C101001]
MTGHDRPDSGRVLLDGSMGEGGGHVLRSALCLSLITGRPFQLTRLRERREPSGLRPQHLAYVRGAEALSTSTSEGAVVGASEIHFTPGPVRAGDYLLEAGASGSTPRLFQCLVYPLALAGGGRLTLRGATHLRDSPSFHALVGAWLPVARAYGLPVQLSLTHAGFHPEGAGEFTAEIGAPVEPPVRVDLPARGVLREVRVMTLVGGLPFAIAERQSRAAVAALRERGILAEADNRPVPVTRSQGTATFILAQFEHTVAAFTSLGNGGHDAEGVGREAAEALTRFMQTGGALDEHLAEQLLLPAALLASGRLGAVTPGTTRFTAARITGAMTVQAEVLRRFLPVHIDVSPGGAVEVRPA